VRKQQIPVLSRSSTRLQSVAPQSLEITIAVARSGKRSRPRSTLTTASVRVRCVDSVRMMRRFSRSRSVRAPRAQMSRALSRPRPLVSGGAALVLTSPSGSLGHWDRRRFFSPDSPDYSRTAGCGAQMAHRTDALKIGLGGGIAPKHRDRESHSPFAWSRADMDLGAVTVMSAVVAPSAGTGSRQHLTQRRRRTLDAGFWRKR
jgi:hypothetical protein